MDKVTYYSNYFTELNLCCETRLYKDFLNIDHCKSLNQGGLYKNLNGTMRILVPDLELWINTHSLNNRLFSTNTEKYSI